MQFQKDTLNAWRIHWWIDGSMICCVFQFQITTESPTAWRIHWWLTLALLAPRRGACFNHICCLDRSLTNLNSPMRTEDHPLKCWGYPLIQQQTPRILWGICNTPNGNDCHFHKKKPTLSQNSLYKIGPLLGDFPSSPCGLVLGPCHLPRLPVCRRSPWIILSRDQANTLHDSRQMPCWQVALQ